MNVHYATISAKTIALLEPVFMGNVQAWLQSMRNANFDPYVYMSYRTPAEQQALYEEHLNGGPQAVPPPMSYHCYGLAIDWVPVGQDGTLLWDDLATYHYGWKVGESFGLANIGDEDSGHLQDARYDTYHDLPQLLYGNPKANA